jgi:hypothetical protein
MHANSKLLPKLDLTWLRSFLDITPQSKAVRTLRDALRTKEAPQLTRSIHGSFAALDSGRVSETKTTIASHSWYRSPPGRAAFAATSF